MSLEIHQIFPIRCNEIYELYKKQSSAFWVPQEIDLSMDKEDWDLKLNDNERLFLSNILSFFSQSDQIVNHNLDKRFKDDIDSLPDNLVIYSKLFYNIQSAIEDIHSITYERLLDTYITNPKDLIYYKKGIENVPCINKKAKWAEKWINDYDSSFMKRLIAFAVLEGIFFSGSFCAIFWIKYHKNDVLSGLCRSNEFISRDEGLHCEFAITLYNILTSEYSDQYHIDQQDILDIFTEAVEIEKEFITDSLPCKLIGMNADLMKQYIEYVADYLLQSLHMEKHYNVENPFQFMENIGLRNKSNFFEMRTNDYAKAGAMDDDDVELELNDDF